MKISDDKSLHIAFGYPYGNGFEPQWVQSLIGLLLHEVTKDPENRVLGSILKHGSCYIDFNRDALANELLKVTKDDWLLMIDPDIQFGADILEKFATHIIANPEAKIIAGRVNLANGVPVFYNHHPLTGNPMHYTYPFVGLKEFDLVGTGIICIHRDVFTTLQEKIGHNHFFNKILSTEKVGVGDDFSFCLRARDAGIKIYGAWDIFGLHWKVQPCQQRYLEMTDL